MRVTSILLAPFTVLALLGAPPAIAQDSGSELTPRQIEAQIRACQARKPQRRSQGALTEGTYRQLERIQTAIGKEEYAEAQKKLNELIERSRSDYEKAVIIQTLGFVYAQQDRMSQAIKAFQQALDMEALPQQAHEQLMLNIAQLLYSEGKLDASLKQLHAYLKESCNPQPDAHIMVAAIYAERKQFRDSLEQVNLGIAKAKEPKESWLQLKLALHYELKDYPACAATLLRLVSIAPNKEQYWKQLSSMYLEIGRDPQSLAVLALADRKGYITEEREFKNLANLYLYLQIPYKAAQVLQRGFDEKALPAEEKNLELLANAWLLAREYDEAEVALRKAAAASDRGELYKRLGHLYVEKENWKAALDALEKAREKGVEKKGELNMLIGVAATQLRQFDRATEAIQLALQDTDTAKQAAEWMSHIQQLRAEEEAARALAEAKAEESAAEEQEAAQPN